MVQKHRVEQRIELVRRRMTYKTQNIQVHKTRPSKNSRKSAIYSNLVEFFFYFITNIGPIYFKCITKPKIISTKSCIPRFTNYFSLKNGEQ